MKKIMLVLVSVIVLCLTGCTDMPFADGAEISIDNRIFRFSFNGRGGYDVLEKVTTSDGRELYIEVESFSIGKKDNK